jgi:hypothetical protein
MNKCKTSERMLGLGYLASLVNDQYGVWDYNQPRSIM